MKSHCTGLSTRSKSLPIINALNNHRFRVHLRYSLNPQQSQQARSKILRLEQLQNKQEEEVQQKIRHWQERSLKKLEERHDCVDKWKKKYIPEYQAVLKHKLSLDSSRNNVHLIRNSPQPGDRLLHKGTINLPEMSHISPPPLSPIDQGKRLQNILMERLERHKKLIDVKNNQVEKEINYFQEFYSVIPPEKRRELQLRKLLFKADRDKAYNHRGLFHKKASLVDPNSKHRQYAMRDQYSRQQQARKVEEKAGRLRKREVQRLQWEVREEQQEVPQGWQTNQVEELGEGQLLD